MSWSPWGAKGAEAAASKEQEQMPAAVPSAPMGKEALLQEVLDCSEDDTTWILERLAAQRRRQYEKARKNPIQLESVLAAGTTDAKGEVPPPDGEVKRSVSAMRLEKDASTAKGEPPVLQFSSSMFFAGEEESSISLEVMRIGNLDGPSEVAYTTVDATAKAGVKYVATSGKLVFQPGVSEMSVSVTLISDDKWDTTTEFKVQLSKEDPAPVNATLGRYLWVTRVKVIDNDTFPSNKYRKEISEGRLHDISDWGLLWQYMKLNWADAVVRRGTIKMALLDQLHNLYFLANLFMNVFLVDRILQNDDRIEETNTGLSIVAGVLVVPKVLLHFLDYREATWKVGGGSRARLQTALLRRFLNYAESSRTDLHQGDLIMAVTRDVTGMVHDGYITAIRLVGLAGQLLAVLVFQSVAPFVFEKDPAVEGFAVLIIFPVVLGTFLFLRQRYTTRLMHAKDDAQDALVQHVETTVVNYRMIADYCRRPYFVDMFTGRIKKYNGAFVACAQVVMNNKYASTWTTVILMAVYIVWGGMSVIDKSETMGMFLANVDIIKQIGGCWGGIYQGLLQLQGVFPQLHTVVELLNLPTDLNQRRAIGNDTRQRTRTMRAELLEQGCPGLPVDNLPLFVEDLNHDFVGGGDESGEGSKPLSCAGRVEVGQGQLAVLIGPHGDGKSTMLRVLSSVILPRPGSVFVPSHLRVYHITNDPQFLHGNLYENLTFGVLAGDPDGNPERVKKILQRLGLPPELVALADPEAKASPWGECLSFSQQCLMCLARALVANPEVLCLHKPTMPFSDEMGEDILSVLQEFCEKKGIEQDDSSRHLRRPRTCILTSSDQVGIDRADLIYAVSAKEGVRAIEHTVLHDPPPARVEEEVEEEPTAV